MRIIHSTVLITARKTGVIWHIDEEAAEYLQINTMRLITINAKGAYITAPSAALFIFYYSYAWNFTSIVISAFSSFDTGQFFFASSAHSLNLASSAPGTLPVTSR